MTFVAQKPGWWIELVLVLVLFAGGGCDASSGDADAGIRPLDAHQDVGLDLRDVGPEDALLRDDAAACVGTRDIPEVESRVAFEDDVGERCSAGTLASSGWTVYRGAPVCMDHGVAITPEADERMMFRSIAGLPAGRYVLAAKGGGLVSLVTHFGELQEVENGEVHTRVVWLPCGTSSCTHDDRTVRFALFDWAGGDAILQLYLRATDAMEWVRIARADPSVTPLEVSGDALPALLTPAAMSRVSLEACSANVRADTGTRTATATFTLPAGLIRLRLEGTHGLSVVLEGARGRRILDDVTGEASNADLLDQHFVSLGEEVRLTLSAPGDFRLNSVRFEPVRDETSLGPDALRAVRPTPWPARGTAIVDATPEGVAPGSRIELALREVARWGANTVRMPVDPIREYRRARGLSGTGPIADPADFWRYYEDESIPAVIHALTIAGSVGLKADLLLLPVVTSGDASWTNPQTTRDMRRAVRTLTHALATTRTADGTRVSQFVWGYDFWNEANDPTTTGNVLPPEWLLLARNLLQVLRDVEAADGVDAAESSFLILDLGVIPSPRFGAMYPVLARHLIPDPRIIYSDHFYEPFPFTHQRICPLDGTYPQDSLVYPGLIEGVRWDAARIASILDAKRSFSASTGAPFYVGEFSASQFAPVNEAGQASQVAWLSDVITAMDAGALSWSYFSYGTYYSWDPLMAPGVSPCGPFTRLDPGDTPTSALLIRAFSSN